MTLEQFNNLKNSLPDNISGRRMGIIIVSDSGFCADAVKMGYKKITKINVAIRKDYYLDIVNKTAGAKKLNVEFKPQRASYYESEKLHGLFSHLKSDPEKKYMELRWDTDDETNKVSSVYVDANLNIVATDLNDPLVKSLYTKSAYTSLTEGYGRTKVMRENDIDVPNLTPKIENISHIAINGKRVTDENLNQYNKIKIKKVKVRK
jgi:hypothetical protein